MSVTMWNTDLLLYASLTFCYFSVPILFTVTILCKHLHMGRIVSVALSVHGFDLYFCFTGMVFSNTYIWAGSLL